MGHIVHSAGAGDGQSTVIGDGMLAIRIGQRVAIQIQRDILARSDSNAGSDVSAPA